MGNRVGEKRKCCESGNDAFPPVSLTKLLSHGVSEPGASSGLRAVTLYLGEDSPPFLVPLLRLPVKHKITLTPWVLNGAVHLNHSWRRGSEDSAHFHGPFYPVWVKRPVLPKVERSKRSKNNILKESGWGKLSPDYRLLSLFWCLWWFLKLQFTNVLQMPDFTC